MKYLEVRDDFQPPIGQEWMPHSYPGNGAYLIDVNGIRQLMIVSNSCTSQALGVEPLLKGGAPGGGSVDLHRFLDQILEIKK